MGQLIGEEKSDMSFLEHIGVLRWHLVRSSIAICVFSIVAFVFSDVIFDDILFALKSTDFWTYRKLCELSHFTGGTDTLCIQKLDFSVINVTMSGQIMVHITVSLIVGFILAFPYVLFEIWRFISPALKNAEKKYASIIIFAGSILFLAGILFGYYIVSPLSVQFMVEYNVSSQAENKIMISSFIKTIANLILVSGIVFELPLIVYVLAKLEIISATFLRKYRRHAIVIMLIFSSIITPTDLASMVAVAIPLLFLYEVSIFIALFVGKKNMS